MWSDEIQGWKLCGRNFDGEGIVVYTVAETGEEIRIGSDFPNEFKGSEDTLKTKGGYKKAKANLVQGIEKMIYIARKTKESDNQKLKNRDKAMNGWFRYLTRFALPVVDEYLDYCIVVKN